MKTERFPTVINGKRYNFLLWGSENMWSANAYDSNNNSVAFSDSEIGSDDAVLKLVKLLESNGK